jgi:hypothetical protein
MLPVGTLEVSAMKAKRKKIRLSVAEPVSAVMRSGAYPAEPGVQPSGPIECALCYAACDAAGGGPLCYAVCEATVC